MSKIAALFQKRQQSIDNKSSLLIDSFNSVSSDTTEATEGSCRSNYTLSSSDFIVTHKLGEGGFGSVWSGMHEKTGEWYAIKEIKKKKIVHNDVAFNMLKNEVKILTRINNNNPYIIEFFSLFQDSNCCYFLLNLNIGNDLRYYLKKKLLFTEENLAFLIGCIASALHYLHYNGIMHRDIKPENILINEKGWPYLTDFGVSYIQEGFPNKNFQCNLVSGTRQYLAPEVFLSDHIHGVESDYWSLGIMMYELLYGKRPYEKHCPLHMIQFVDKCYKKKNDKIINNFEADEKFNLKKGFSSPHGSPSSATNSACSTSSTLSSPCGSPGSKKILFPNISTDSNEAVTNGVIFKNDELNSLKLPKISSFNPTITSNKKSKKVGDTSYSTLSLKEALNSDLIGTTDYWNVDVDYDFIMDNSLFIPLTMSNSWLGEISTDCLDLLQGLLDIRPHCRLGGRNFLALKNLNFFKKFNMISWETDLNPLHSNYKPGVKPSKKIIDELLFKVKNSDAIFLNEYSESLSDFEEESDEFKIKSLELNEFNYISNHMILESTA